MAKPRVRSSRWLQFNLRTLFALVTILCVGMGIVGRWHLRAVRQRDAILAFTSRQFNNADYEEDLSTPEMPGWIPKSLRGQLTVDHFHDIKHVYLIEPTTDQLQRLSDVPRLEKLHLNDWSENQTIHEPRSLDHVAGLGQLKSLALSAVTLQSSAAEAIGHLRSLRELILFGCQGLDDQAIERISRLPLLESLQIDNTKGIHDLSPIQQIGQLRKLDLSTTYCDEVLIAMAPGFAPSSPIFVFGNRASKQVLPRVGSFRTLTNLKLHGDASLAPELLSGFESLVDLKTLQVMGPSVVTDAALTSVAKAPGLARLEIRLSGANTTTDEGLAQLAQIPCLKELSLELGAGVTDVGLGLLGRAGTLRELRLVVNDGVTGEALAKLGSLESLDIEFEDRDPDARHLQLRFPDGLKRLLISNCANLSDSDLQRVSELKSLEYLSLSGCPRISNAGISHLKRLTRLATLEIHKLDQVTIEAIDELKKAAPGCFVGGSVKGGMLQFRNYCGPFFDPFWD